jgi:hypothetical protein
MFARSINDTSRVVRMMIVGDATTWSVIIESSFYDRNMFIIQAAEWSTSFKQSTSLVLKC